MSREIFKQALDKIGYKGAIILTMPPRCFMEYQSEKYRQGRIMAMNVEDGAFRQRMGIFFRYLTSTKRKA